MRIVLILAIAAWAAGVGGGVSFLWSYTNRPGPAGPTAPAWPKESALELSRSVPTLIMFIHPQCPCSRASVEELNTLLARATIQPVVTAVFVRPAGLEPGWEKRGLWDSVAAIPGIESRVDPEGVEARRFGVQTSGHVLLFGPDGALRFTGGITAARGHSGDNAGLSAVLERLKSAGLPPATTPVFGCLLLDETTLEDKP